MQETIKELVETHPVVLFLKGTKEMPVCGFSYTVVDVLNRLDIPFHAVNILEDEEMRAGIKVFSNWPTIPQLYINGTFIGGCDIVVELYESGALEKHKEEINGKSGTEAPATQP